LLDQALTIRSKVIVNSQTIDQNPKEHSSPNATIRLWLDSPSLHHERIDATHNTFVSLIVVVQNKKVWNFCFNPNPH